MSKKQDIGHKFSAEPHFKPAIHILNPDWIVNLQCYQKGFFYRLTHFPRFTLKKAFKRILKPLKALAKFLKPSSWEPID